jgi:Na+/melibiose symporter-like transporter
MEDQHEVVRFRPRILYATLFVWISITGGRFLAPFLEHEAQLSSSQIGLFLGVQQCIGVPVSSLGGVWADSLERKHPGRGRALVMALGVATGGLFFVLHGAGRLAAEESSVFRSVPWYFILRVLFSFSVAIIFPVVDGMCLAFLEKEPGCSPDDYGKERLYGAYTWAITNIILAPCLDYFGFEVVYPFAIVSTLVLLISVYGYSQERVHHQLPQKQHRIQKRQSDVIQEDTSPELNQQSEPSQKTKEEERISSWTLFRLLVTTFYGVAFLFAVLTLSSGQAVVESLVFLFFEFLGGSYTFMGLTVVLTVAFEIPIFHIAPKLLQRFGAAALLLVAAFCYIVRVIGYSLIPEGSIGYVLFFEPLHGVTYACAVTSTVDFVSQLMPEGYEASGQGIIYVVRGSGSILGLFLGGWAEDVVGPRVVYRIFATIVLVGSATFGIALAFRDKTVQHQVLSQTDNVEMTESGFVDESPSELGEPHAAELIT